MAWQPRTLNLSNRQRKQLLWHRDHDVRPYVRERTAALLKIAEGQTPHAVAQHGLLKPRDPDTVYTWLEWYEAAGFDALVAHAPGGYRGIWRESRRDELETRLQQAPPAPTPTGTSPASPPAPARWKLVVIQRTLPWLETYSLSGVWRLVQDLDIHWKQGYVRQWSPDPAYSRKRKYIEQCLKQAARDPEQVVVIFLDEMGYYRWPSAAHDWVTQSQGPPLAWHADANNQQWRIIGGLNALSGQVTYHQNYIVGREAVIRLHQQVDTLYAEAQRIYVVQDNWNIHTHPDVQTAVAALARIEQVWLPTYASWLNPIEKVWRWLRQDLLHHHRYAEDWNGLKQQVAGWLDQFAQGSQDLLRYVGLLGQGRFARALRV